MSPLHTALLALASSAAACVTEPTTSKDRPAAHERIAERDLDVVRLDPTAVARLGIVTAVVERTQTARTREVGGIVTVPPGRAIVVTAPLAGTLRAGDVELTPGSAISRGDVLLKLVPLAPVDRDLRAQARRQRDAGRARLDVATARLERTRALVEQRGASQRALEEAEAELATAQAEHEAANARERMIRRSPLDADAMLSIAAPQDGVLRSVTAAPGQSVAAGAMLFEVASTSSLWVRVPLYPGELDRIASDEPIRVARLGSDPSRGGDEAQPVAAPPSADPIAGSVDTFYVLAPGAAALHPGERVLVQLAYDEREVRSAVPASAVVVDATGGAWVYECVDDTSFRRRRVDVVRHDGQRAVLGRGPAEGTCIVAVGALELFGTEFGVAH